MIDINCDMGESFGIWKLADDAEVMKYVTTVNVACGFHASDPTTMANTVALAAERGVNTGAHPGLPDLWGFGRRAMAMTPDEVRDLVAYQVGALSAFLIRHDVPLHHVKPHGSLYGMTARDEPLAVAAAEVAARHNASLAGMADTAHETAAERVGVPFIREAFADLDYADDGSLIITRSRGALDLDAVATKVRRLVSEGTVESEGGKELPITFDSICFHSDTPNPVDLARAVFEAARGATKEE